MVRVTAPLRIDEVRVNLEGADGEHLALRLSDGMDSPRSFASNCGALVNIVVGISSSNERSPK